LRTLAVLELLSTSDEKQTLSEIARALNISTSTLFPILHTLREKEYLGFDKKSQTYSLGKRLFEIGSRVLHSSAYQEISGIVDRIAEACGETVHFGTLDWGDVLYLAKGESRQPIRMYSTIGKRIPAYGTAIGKALLKNYSIEELKRLYPEGLKPLTAKTITDFAELYGQLHGNGIFVYECEESTEGLRCIAVPIYRQGAVVAACSVAVPLFRYDEEKKVLIEHLLKGALIEFEQMIHLVAF